MPTTTTYNPVDGSLTVGGTLITNWNEIEIGRDEPSFSSVPSTTGHQAHIKNNNKNGFIMIRLPVFSKDNDLMSAFEIAGSLIQCGFADMSGTTRAFIGSGRVEGAPNKTFSKGGTEVVEWKVFGDMPIYFVGGNN